MKPLTAAALMTAALKNEDLEGLVLACQYRPWVKVGASLHPLRVIAETLESARRSRKGKIANARIRVQPYLQALARHGYRPTGAALADFGSIDTPSMISFAQTALDFSHEHPPSNFILHRLVASGGMQAAWIRPLVDVGFDVNLQDGKGNTPAHFLVDLLLKSSRTEIIARRLATAEALLHHGADFSLCNRAGVCPADGIMQMSALLDQDQARAMVSCIAAQVLAARAPEVSLPSSARRL